MPQLKPFFHSLGYQLSLLSDNRSQSFHLIDELFLFFYPELTALPMIASKTKVDKYSSQKLGFIEHECFRVKVNCEEKTREMDHHHT